MNNFDHSNNKNKFQIMYFENITDVNNILNSGEIQNSRTKLHLIL